MAVAVCDGSTAGRESTVDARRGLRLHLVWLLALVLPLAACDTADDDTGSAGGAPATAQGGPDDGGDDGDDGNSGDVFGRIPEIVDEVEPSVVAILTDGGEGSGVVWDADGTIVTNDHVVAGAEEIEIAFADGRRSPAELVGSDPVSDLAVVRSERDGLPAVELADELPEVGALAVAIGNPFGFENTVTAGIVSGVNRAIPGTAPGTQALVDLIQTDAPISPGNSGGALVGVDGRVMGINVAFIPPAARAVSIGFAIPAPTVRDVVTQLLDDGSVEHAFLGIAPAQLTPQIADRLGVEAERGVVVLEVVEGGPADEAGIAAGDVITMIGDRSVETVEELLGALRDQQPGDEITVTLVSDGEDREVDVMLTERPTES